MGLINVSGISYQAWLGLLATVLMLLLVVPAKPLMAAGGGGWSSATAISPANQPDPTRGSQLNDVAVNASGITIAAWEQYTYNNGGGATIGAAVQSGGRWSASCFFSDEGGSCIDPNLSMNGFSLNPRVAVGADGTMAVSWTYQDPMTQPNPRQKIQVAVRPAGSNTWTTTTLAQGAIGGVAITPPVPVGVDASGNVTAAWTLWDGTRHVHVVQSATFQNGAWPAPPHTTLSGNDDGLYLSLSVNAAGDAAVAYTHSPYAPYNSNCQDGQGTCAYYVYRNGPDGTWTSPVQVSETISASVGYITNPQVALDSNGLATLIYMGYGLEATRQSSLNSWTMPAPIIQTNIFGASYLSPDLAVDENGNAVVAVSIFDPAGRSSVYVARGDSGGNWASAQRLTDPTVPVDAYATRVAISPNGALALVGWIDHYHGAVQVSKLTNDTWGAATTIGRGTAYSSFQEVLGLDAGSSTVARAIWKNAKSGTRIYASSYNK